jgi:hypothetical protein
MGFFLLVVMSIVGQRHFSHSGISRETREEWPLLTLEAEVNGDSKSTNERGSFLGWFVRACRAGTKDFCSALVALVGPAQNIFFLTVHYFNSFGPIAQQPGQAVVLGRLSLSMCLLEFPTANFVLCHRLHNPHSN